ncbi:aldehyde dehydrogenase family protein [Rhodococcus sp. 24CO]|uniref:aldehyde dehydrogenase family protein n=1 Tax=Rhodococcus sp. 24CO TaxID=3117460 RepID=UPI003D347348
MKVEHDTVYVNGVFAPALTKSRISVVNPATGQEFGTVPSCGAEDVDRAVGAARLAFDEGRWHEFSASERAKALDGFADELALRTDDFAHAITREAGFASAVTATSHVGVAIEFVRYYADLTRDSAEADVRWSALAHADVRIRRCPLGVVAVLVPWNIPLLGALSKIAAALAAGCTVVYKPSPETPLTGYLLAEAADAAGFPPGVINVIPADMAGSQHLVSHRDVDMVAFTGSTAVGRSIAQTCAADFRRYALELGGNAAAIVLDDAPLELVAPGLAMLGVALNNGQACIAQRRILVPRDRHDEIVAALAAAVAALPVGDPTDPTVIVGPLISAAHRERVLNHIRKAQAAGAVVVVGGGAPDRDGFFVEPTVLSNVTNDMHIAQEEVFGPVVCVIAYDTVEDAIRIAGDTEYGLSSSIWSADLERAELVARRLRVGSVYINGTMALDPAVPFGGFGDSGVGRELGPEGLDEYTEIQSIFVPAVG